MWIKIKTFDEAYDKEFGLRGFMSQDPFLAGWNVIYLSNSLTFLGRLFVLFHEFFHWFLRYIEWVKGDYIFSPELDFAWDHLWQLKIKDAFAEFSNAIRSY